MRIVFLLLLICSSVAFAESNSFADLKKEYLHLRNTDIHITDESSWRSVAVQLELFAEKHANGEGAQALFNAAKMYRAIYQEKNTEDDLRKAQKLLEEIADERQGTSVAPEALKELAELGKRYDNDDDKAKGYLKRIIKEYPRSDYYDYAFKAVYEDGLEERSQSATSNGSGNGKIVVLDPGHGGEDFGAVGVSGLLEKDVVLDVAFLLEEKLKAFGAKVILTRRDDTFIPVQKRMEIANDAQANVFVSLHANSSETGNIRGFEIYVLDNTNDKASKTLSERENASGGGVDDVSFMLSDLIQTSKTPESAALAQSIQNAVAKEVPMKWPGTKILKVKKAPFYVLVGAHMPAVLAELFFINEPEDGALLAESRFRKDLANALFTGITEHLGR